MLARDIHGSTERQPDLARRHTSGERLIGRTLTQGREHQIAHETAAIRLTKLVGDGAQKLASGQKITRYR